MISIARIFIILATLIISISLIHRANANNVYYLSKNNCESGEEAELVDCLRNEVIESTITLRKAEDNIRLRIHKWSEVKSAALDDAIPIALYRLDKSNQEFIRYRLAQCSFAESWGNGVGSFTRIYSCMAELNRQRAEQLIHANIPDYTEDIK
ncbi:lysozyme inhibitor LprI family protein [Kluyvera sp. NPDC087067]|uniref:lysozyme inhibitor LprI family protein n=1 Tax=unclassified Kluyvera TaxID=2619995 RepID=UPI0037FAEBBF